ncbi:hypothetical protein MSAN_00085500 [Mycena sanguinolenta]|uniref:F-box domain-containing protein n=1 Tax=Mycena sanguinolenta TaxID=230812 RepID=A0A8H6ZJJ1_9AGAR|nr:hypothetical protein MSAN_00085500 [Mycena sanguinolenta]
MSSPFASKLGTNYCPLDAEIPEIQALLVEPLSRLRSLDDRIAHLQKAIDELAQERTGVKAYVDAHQALLSPIRRLPLDILQEIFVACLPTHRNCVMSAGEAPVLLGRICSSWRDLCLSTPRLWSRLHIVEPSCADWETTLYGAREAKQAQRVEITKAWLARSGQCPLSISLCGSSRPHPAPPGYTSTSVFLQTLISFASRWQDVSLLVSSSDLNNLGSISENDVPLLKVLDIKEIYDSPQGAQWGFSGLLRAPAMSSFTCNSNPVASSLRWEQLLSLSIVTSWVLGVTSEVVVEIFSRCPRLHTCRLVMNDTDTSSAADGPVLELLSLHSLHVTSVGSPIHRTGGLFNRISLPELRHLRIHVVSRVGTANHTYFPFLTVSPRLEVLQLDMNDQTLEDLVRTLPPTIQRLKLHCAHYYAEACLPQLLEALTPSPLPDRSGCICPMLQELHFISCSSLSDRALLDFIVARMAFEQPTLRRVEISFVRAIQLDIRPDTQPFLDAGLELVTTYVPPPALMASPWYGLADERLLRGPLV